MPSIADTPWLVPGDSLDSFFGGAALGNQIFKNREDKAQGDVTEAYRRAQEQKMQAEEDRKAQEAAIRFQGLQGLQTDVDYLTQLGNTPEEALKISLPKHLPKIAFSSPASLESLLAHSDMNDFRKAQLASADERAAQALDMKQILANMEDSRRRDLADQANQNKFDLAIAKYEGQADLPSRKNDVDFRAFLNKAAVIRSDRTLSAEDKLARLDRLKAEYQSVLAGGPGLPPAAEPDEADLEIQNLDGQIKKLQLDMTKNPRTFWDPLFDVGEDNRQIKLDELLEQRRNIVDRYKTPSATTNSPAAKPLLRWDSKSGTYK